MRAAAAAALLRLAHLLAPADRYVWLPILTPPFRNQTDRRVALCAALVHVTHLVTGEWPRANKVIPAVEILMDDNNDEK